MTKRNKIGGTQKCSIPQLFDQNLSDSKTEPDDDVLNVISGLMPPEVL